MQNGYNSFEGFKTPYYGQAVPIKQPPLYYEKRGVKRAGLIIGLCLNITLALSLLIGFNSVLLPLFKDPAWAQAIQIVYSMLLFTLPFIIVFKSFGERISSLVSFKKVGKTAVPLFFMGIAVCAFANISASLASGIFESFGFNYNVDYGKSPDGVFGFLLSFLATAVVPALLEEFAFRGIVLGYLRRFGDAFAIIVSSVLFGIIHGNFEQMPFAALIGFMLAFTVVKTGSLRVAVAIHFFNNFQSVLFDYPLSGLTQSKQNLIYGIILTVSLLLGIVAIKVFGNDENFFKIESAKTETKLGKKILWFFTSVLIIIFVAFCFLESLVYFI